MPFYLSFCVILFCGLFYAADQRLAETPSPLPCLSVCGCPRASECTNPTHFLICITALCPPQVIACAIPADCTYSGRMDKLIKYQAEMILFPEL